MSEPMNYGRDSFDEKMATALMDLPVPTDLEQRLLARIAENDMPSLAGEGTNVSAAAALSSHRRISRRRWLALAGAVAASIAVAVGISVWPRQENHFTLVQLLDSAPAWFEKLRASDAWQSPDQLPRGLTPSRSVNAGIVQWRDAARIVGRSAAAYALASASGKRATLLVIAQAERIAASTPPPTPQGTTLGLMIGCWQQGDLVYVLLVEGRERDYREFLSPGSRPSVT